MINQREQIVRMLALFARGNVLKYTFLRNPILINFKMFSRALSFWELEGIETSLMYLVFVEA